MANSVGLGRVRSAAASLGAATGNPRELGEKVPWEVSGVVGFGWREASLGAGRAVTGRPDSRAADPRAFAGAACIRRRSARDPAPHVSGIAGPRGALSRPLAPGAAVRRSADGPHAETRSVVSRRPTR